MKKSNEAFEKLKRDLKEGTVRCAYIFYGEESYLREYYLGALRITNYTKFVKRKKYSAVVYFMHKWGAFYIPKVSRRK